MVLGLAVLAGCQIPEVPEVAGSEVEIDPGYEANCPLEIAILPVQSVLADHRDVLPTIRQGVYSQLIQKRYTALNLAYVDEEIDLLDAGGQGDREIDFGRIRGQMEEDAMLRVRLESFDTEPYHTRGRIVIGADWLLIDSQSGEQLWRARVEEVVDMREERDVLTMKREYEPRAIELYVKSVLARLPDKVDRTGIDEAGTLPR
ncbi:MAG: hypothetical protein RL885_04025 [Planctomycetota bacterium]